MFLSHVCRACVAALLLTGVGTALAQPTSFTDQIARHRATYRAEFLKEAGSPLRSQEAVDSLRFFAPDSTYRVEATVLLTPDAEPFDMPTYDGKRKPHVQYALLSFTLQGRPHQLAIYRSLNLMKLPNYRDYLFVPFRDATSGKTTYGGGRYMDFRLGDIRAGHLTLDFNKAYNPYCAYRDGYSCPVPPPVNQLPVAVEAGEQAYH